VTLTVTAPPLSDFSLSASPSSRTVSRHGGSVTYVVTITPGNGFTGTVTLSVSGLPSRASGSFSPNPATTSSTLTVNTSNGTTVTTYTLIITGVSAGLTHTTMVTLVVT
jgi:serine protease AprX